MALQAAICTQCGAQIQVDKSKETGICPSCGTAFITEKVIHQFVTQNNFAGATINVQGGVDIENLYTLARRAVETDNIDDVIRYYGQIRERNPNDWEATFFYAWLTNSENFHSDFKITEELIFKLDTDKQIEAVKRIYNFFKKINFTLETNYVEKSSFPLQDQKLYYDFVMKFFDNKNTEVLEYAQYLIDYMDYWGAYGEENLYREILARNDKFYAKFLQKYHWVLHKGPVGGQDEKASAMTILSTEGSIDHLNELIDSEDDKKNNYTGYYKFLLEKCADRLKPGNLKYIENRINELGLSYEVSAESKTKVKKAYKEAKEKKLSKVLSIIYAILLLLLSSLGVFLLYNTDHSFCGTLSLVSLLILNIFAFNRTVNSSYYDNSAVRILLKITILVILFFVFRFLYKEEFYWIF